MPPRTSPSIDPKSIPYDVYALAYALADALIPKFTWVLTTIDQNQQITVSTELLDDVNLFVECGSAGIVEFQLEKDGDAKYTQQQVVAGQRIFGRFKRIGPNTNVYPLIGYGNSSQRSR